MITATGFVDSVLALRPKIATFDCDGTLWSGDAGEGFFSWELTHGIISDEIVRWARIRYAEYRAGNVPEEVMCGEMVTMHHGLRESEILAAARHYFDQHFLANIFPEMQQLVSRLQNQGCDVWAVSSTNEWVIREAMRHFGIAGDRVIAASVKIDGGVITDSLIRVPSGPGKATGIREVIQRTPDAAFGNSIWDADMLRMARHAFAVNANPNLKSIAEAAGWTIYSPTPPQC
jgi:phosphoserine phosphatase